MFHVPVNFRIGRVWFPTGPVEVTVYIEAVETRLEELRADLQQFEGELESADKPEAGEKVEELRSALSDVEMTRDEVRQNPSADFEQAQENIDEKLNQSIELGAEIGVLLSEA